MVAREARQRAHACIALCQTRSLVQLRRLAVGVVEREAGVQVVQLAVAAQQK